MRLPLEGIRVIDLTRYVLGPHATKALGEMGAEVIKIEDHTTGGDPTRGSKLLGGVQSGRTDINPSMELYNRNKKSVTVDLRAERGREIIYKLVKKSDVFVTNLRQAPILQLGLDYDTLAKLNPRLVYAFISGCGPRGPDAAKASWAVTIFGRVGLMASMGEPGTPPPLCTPGLIDHVAGMLTAYGVMLALYVREKSGIGQRIDTSLLSAATDMACSDLQGALVHGVGRPRRSRKEVVNPLFNTYQTKDGKWIIIACPQTDPFWAPLCRALEIQEVEGDPRFGSHERRCQNGAALISIMDEAFSKRTWEEWNERLNAEDIMWDTVREFTEAVTDPQMLENEYIVDFDHPTYGAMKVVGIPVRLSETPGAIRSPAPQLGQHTEEVLTEILGYSWASIEALKEQRVIL